jgi:hypothetical protein
MAIMRAIIEGKRNPVELAELRDRRCRKSAREIAEQLSGHWREDHLFSLKQAVKMYDAIQERLQDYEREILRGVAEAEREDCRGLEPPKLNPKRRRPSRSGEKSPCGKLCIE